MSAHWLLAVGFAGMAVAIFFLGWSARIMRVEWRDDRALRAAEARYERHSHRKGDPLPPAEAAAVALPLSGRLAVEPDPDDWRIDRQAALDPLWLFAGESAPGWGSESAEYELLTQAVMCPDCHHNNSDCRCGPDPEDYDAIPRLTQTAEQPVSVTGEPPIDTGELLAITDRVETWISQWTAQGNYDRHTMRAD